MSPRAFIMHVSILAMGLRAALAADMYQRPLPLRAAEPRGVRSAEVVAGTLLAQNRQTVVELNLPNAETAKTAQTPGSAVLDIVATGGRHRPGAGAAECPFVGHRTGRGGPRRRGDPGQK